MQMHYLLPAVFAAVANEAVSALIESHRRGYLLDKGAHLCHHFRRRYLEVFVAFFRDRQDMDRCFWVDVVEGQKFIVFQHFVARDFAVYDLFEDVHFRSFMRLKFSRDYSQKIQTRKFT